MRASTLLVLLTACGAPEGHDGPNAPSTALRLALEPTTGAVGWASPSGDPVSAAAWGDVDADGQLDLILGRGITRWTPDDVIVRALPFSAHRGVGRDFARLETPDIRSDVGAVAWGDPDEDGQADLLVGEHVQWESGLGSRVIPGALALLVAQGGALVVDWVAPEGTRWRTTDLAWADVDDDGDLDFAEAGREGLRLWRADGDGWSPEVLFEGDCQSLAWADLDGDGAVDLSAGCTEGLAVLPNRDGTPDGSSAALLLDQQPIVDVAWGDWLGTGRLHPAVATDQDVRVFRATETGLVQRLSHPRTGASPRAVRWADFDADGDLDLAVGWSDGTAEVLEGFPSFTGQVLEPGWEDVGRFQAATVVQSADWDGDGDEDLMVGRGELASTREALTAVYESLSGEPSMERADLGIRPTTGAAADWDGDGQVEILFVVDLIPAFNEEERYSELRWVRGTPDGGLITLPDGPPFGFPAPAQGEAGVRILRVAPADWDGDGVLEVTLATSEGMVVLAREGDALRPVYSEPTGWAASDLAWADADADGDLDVAVAGDAHLRVLRNDGGVLRQAWEVPLAAGEPTLESLVAPNRVSWAHLDGDGRRQLVVRHGGEGADALLVFDAAALDGTPWPRRPLAGVPSDLLSVLPLDANGDGDDELYLGTATADWLVDVVGDRLERQWEATLDATSIQITAGDIDQDGFSDVAVGGGVTTILQQHREQAWVPTLRRVEDNGASPLLVDTDGDGDLDLVSYGNGGVFVDRNGRGPGETLPYNATRLRLRWDESPGVPASARSQRRLRQDGPVQAVLTLTDPESDPVRGLRFEFRDWGGPWRAATVQDLPDTLETAPAGEGGRTYSATWDWEADLADGEDAQLRVVLDAPRLWGGDARLGRTAAATTGTRLFLDSDDDGVRDTTDPCPLDASDDSLVDGVCNADALAAGWWCSTSGSDPRALLWILVPLLVRRRRVSAVAAA